MNRPGGGFNDQCSSTRGRVRRRPDLVYLDRAEGRARTPPRVRSCRSTSCIKSQKIDKKPVPRRCAERDHVQGARSTASRSSRPVRTLIVNHDALTSRRHALRGQTKNWKRLLATAKKLVKIDGNGKVTRIGFDPKIPEFFPLWAKAIGVDILSKDGLKAAPERPEGGRGAGVSRSADQRAGRLGQVQVVPRHVGLLRREERDREESARGLPDGELVTTTRSPATSPKVTSPLCSSTTRRAADQLRDRLGWADPEGLEERDCTPARG